MFSRSVPRKTAGDDELYAAALRALMRRAHSVHEMQQYLGKRAADPSGVMVVITHLRDQGYLDDAKYARDYARLHAQSRRQGRYRIARELRTRGVSDAHIDAALDGVFAETDEASLVRVRIQRKLASLRGGGKAVDQKKVASIYRSLIAAGFSGDVIRSEIHRATKADAADLPEVPNGEDAV